MSEGMLCSETELEIGDDDSGLKILPSDAPLGVSMGEYLGQKRDILFDIDNKSITHRPDLWGHYGMAREFAAVFGEPPEGLLRQRVGGKDPFLDHRRGGTRYSRSGS